MAPVITIGGIAATVRLGMLRPFQYQPALHTFANQLPLELRDRGQDVHEKLTRLDWTRLCQDLAK